MITRESTPQEIHDEAQNALDRARELREYGRALRAIATRLEDTRSESDIRDDLERRTNDLERHANESPLQSFPRAVGGNLIDTVDEE